MEETRSVDYRLTLVGNANVGKTSLYNALTHSSDHVGNWHGVTVTSAKKSVLYRHKHILFEDLPGIYSVCVDSGEEVVSRDAILARDFDYVINICEVNNLPRNLYLTLQLLEMRIPLVVGINMVDELKKLGKNINYRYIEQKLGVPVVPVSAKYHSDIHLLIDVVLDQSGANRGESNVLDYLDALPIGEVAAIIEPNARAAGFTDMRMAAIKVMDADAPVLESLALSDGQLAALARFGDLQERIAAARYDKIDSITGSAITLSVMDEHHEMHEHAEHHVPLEGEVPPETKEQLEEEERGLSRKDRRHYRHHDRHKARQYAHGYSVADRVLLNKYCAIPLFFVIMGAVFLLTFGGIGGWNGIGGWIGDGIDYAIRHWIRAPIENGLTSIGTPIWVIELLCGGVIDGVGGILVFIPQITLLFLFLSLMEDSGYMSRVAFMMDGLFRKLGLSGKASFTLLMGFGCSATAVMTARNLEDPMVKRKTILLTPFMSCSARLPVYTTVAAIFFHGSGLVIYGLYLLGIAVALAWAKILSYSKRMKSDTASFIMEMPPYRFPTIGRVLKIVWDNIRAFLIRVGTLIFAVNVIVWVLSNFSLTQGFVPGGEGSIMSWIAGGLRYLFVPLGFGSWQATTALLSGLVAKEVVASTLLSFGGEAFLATLFPSAAAAFSFLTFVLLYVPCVATIGAIAREEGWKQALLCIAMQIGTAYLVSLVVYWTGYGLSMLTVGVRAGVILAAAVLAAAAITIAVLLRRRNLCVGCPHCGACSGSCAKNSEKRK